MIVDGEKGVDIVLATNEVVKLIEEFQNFWDEIEIDFENFQQSWDFQIFLEDFQKKIPSNPQEIEFCGLRPLNKFQLKCNSFEKNGTSNNYLNQILLKLAQDLEPESEFSESMIKNKQRRNKDFIVYYF